MSPFDRWRPKLGNLPESHADKVTQPCDWCGQSIPHEHPPASLLLNIHGSGGSVMGFESRSWRLCEQCLDSLVALVKTRVDGAA